MLYMEYTNQAFNKEYLYFSRQLYETRKKLHLSSKLYYVHAHVPFEWFRSIRKYLPHKNSIRIDIGLHGEPLMNKGFWGHVANWHLFRILN